MFECETRRSEATSSVQPDYQCKPNIAGVLHVPNAMSGPNSAPVHVTSIGREVLGIKARDGSHFKFVRRYDYGRLEETRGCCEQEQSNKITSESKEGVSTLPNSRRKPKARIQGMLASVLARIQRFNT